MPQGLTGIHRGQLGEQRLFPGQAGSTAIDAMDGIGPEARQRRQNAVAQGIAGKARIVVAGVVHPGAARADRQGHQSVARPVEKRPPVRETTPMAPGGHAGQTTTARATQQCEQDGLGLVVGVVGSHQHRRVGRVVATGGAEGLVQRRVARLAGGGFQRTTPLAGLRTHHVHAGGKKRHAEGRRLPAGGLLPLGDSGCRP